MSRLTKKNNGYGSWTQFDDKYIPAHNVKHKECVNKLGELEDILQKYNIDNANDLDIEIRANRDKVYKYESIEKELGIDLITLFKAGK